MCVAQVGQSSSGCAAPRPGATQHPPDAKAKFVFQLRSRRDRGCLCTLLQRDDALLLEAKKAAGEWRTGSLTWKPACLDGGLCSEPSVFGDGNLDDSTEAFFERGLHPLSTKV